METAIMQPNGTILDGYIPQEQFAKDLDVDVRTIDRYRAQPDGLPYVKLGGKIFIPLDIAREWLLGRVKRPNQRRA
jgi:hypothetical protein